MTRSDARPNWLSEIIEEKRHVSERPVPLLERKAERDAILMAIRAHPAGQRLTTIADLDDVVWEALGVAHNREQEARQNPHVLMASPAIQASLFILDLEQPERDSPGG
jgi:hypothetical protein